MKEQEMMLFLNTLAHDITEHFNTTHSYAFHRYYIIDGVHYSVIVRECSYKSKYRFEIFGVWVDSGYIYKSSKTYAKDCDYISTAFLELPKLIVSILRELNSRD